METSISSPIAARPSSTPTLDPRDCAGNSTAWASLALGVAGLLPVLPVVGSAAAVVIGWLSLHRGSARSRGLAAAGLVLGAVGLVMPILGLFVYCSVLGYPFPIHHYHPGR